MEHSHNLNTNEQRNVFFLKPQYGSKAKNGYGINQFNEEDDDNDSIDKINRNNRELYDEKTLKVNNVNFFQQNNKYSSVKL